MFPERAWSLVVVDRTRIPSVSSSAAKQFGHVGASSPTISTGTAPGSTRAPTVSPPAAPGSSAGADVPPAGRLRLDRVAGQELDHGLPRAVEIHAQALQDLRGDAL